MPLSDDLMEIEACECSWTDADEEMDKACGCGEHRARLYRDVVYHYQGKHWTIGCLVRALGKELRAARKVVEAAKLVYDFTRLTEYDVDKGERVAIANISDFGELGKALLDYDTASAEPQEQRSG